MRARGFTFIEACVCISITMILAAVTVPNVVREAHTRSHRMLRKQLRDMAVQVKSRAVETRRTVALSYDKSSRSVKAVEEDSTGVSQPLPELKIPDDVTVERLLADRDESPADGWRVPFFADGSTPGGGLELLDGGESYSLIVDRNSGTATIIPGKLPDLSLESWPAGGLQKRGS